MHDSTENTVRNRFVESGSNSKRVLEALVLACGERKTLYHRGNGESNREKLQLVITSVEPIMETERVILYIRVD